MNIPAILFFCLDALPHVSPHEDEKALGMPMEVRAVEVRHTMFLRSQKKETKRIITGQILEEYCQVLGKKEKSTESN